MAANSFTKWLKPAITTWSGEGKWHGCISRGFLDKYSRKQGVERDKVKLVSLSLTC